MEDLKVIATGEHLIQKELQDIELVKQGLEPIEQTQQVGQVLGVERMRQKTKRKMLVGGGAEEEMDVD